MDGIIGDDGGNHIGQNDGHGIAFFDAHAGKVGGEPVHHVFQLLVSHGVALEIQRHAVRILGRASVQNVGHANLFVLNFFRNTLVVRFQPRF